MNQFTHPWTDERVELLRKLRADGLSASQIAARLNVAYPDVEVTRMAVLGKTHRLGLPTRSTRVSCRVKPHKSKPWRHKQVFGLVDKHTPPRLEADGFVPPADEPIPLEQRKTIATLKDGDCRWPVGDPQDSGFHFCGAEKVPGLSYCRQHAMRAHVVPDQRRRVREISSMPVGMKERENV